MKKRVIYRYVGVPGKYEMPPGGIFLKPGQFIDAITYEALPASETIRQEIKVADPQEARYVTHQL